MEEQFESENLKPILLSVEFSRLDYRLLERCPFCDSPLIHLATCDVCPLCGSLAGCMD